MADILRQATKKQTTPNKSRANQLLDEYKIHKSARQNIEGYWQSLHDYFYIESMNVQSMQAPGSELRSTNLYDSTSLEAADVLASGFMNYLTPPTTKWFSLKAKNPKLKDNKKVGTYLQDVAEEVNYLLNRTNFYSQMFPNYKSSGVYGTSALYEEEDAKEDAVFYAMPLKQVVLVEDYTGNVKKYFIEFEYTAEQAADRWGAEKLDNKMQEELKAQNPQNKKHPFLLYIANRSVRKIDKVNKENMPIEATWIDVDNRKIIEEGGYNEFPAMCHRFDKRPFMAWGFSPAMKALPFARVLNTIAKTNLRAMMKQTDPPIALPNNAFIMPFSGNPRAVNYYNKTKMDAKDIFAFGNFGDPKSGMLAIEYYTNQVKSLMYNDVFLAFDNLTKQMNNPEIAERINEKMTMLGPAVGRYISEMLNPVVIRSIGILARRRKLPPPPQEFIEDPTYEIDCVSQLAQAQRRSELSALMNGLTLVGQMSQFAPEVLDKVSSDKAVDEAWGIIGAPVRVLRDDKEVEEIREARGKMAQQQMQMSMAQQGADVIEKGSKVDLNVSAAQEKGKK